MTESLKEQSMKKYHILLVDDSPDILEAMCSILQDEGYQCITASSGEVAIGLLATKSFELIITDLNMYNISGIDILKKSKAFVPKPAVIILTGNRSLELWREAKRLGVDDYVFKPCNLTELLNRVSNCLATSAVGPKRISGENRPLHYQPGYS
jgi:DNA-binding response OmpR family regulator